MTKAEFLNHLEELLEAERGTLTGGEACADLDNWDSLAVLSYMALLDREFKLKVPWEQVQKCRTVDDLVALAGDRVTP